MAAPGYPSPMAGYPSPPYPTPPYPGPSAPPAPSSPGFHDYPGPPHHQMHPPVHPQPVPLPGGAPYMPVSTGTGVGGLAYLDQIDQILIHQKTELLEAVTGFETCNQYELRNSMGQRIFSVRERSTLCARWCCGSLRPLTLQVFDSTGREVIHFVRPLKCASCCFSCCLQEMEVQSPPGQTIGYVAQTWHPFVPKYSLLTETREPVLKVVGPCILSNCCGDVNFQVKPMCESRSVGLISKQWSGLPKEIFTDADNFGIQFPKDLNVKMKAVLLGACFLLWWLLVEAFARCVSPTATESVIYTLMHSLFLGNQPAVFAARWFLRLRDIWNLSAQCKQACDETRVTRHRYRDYVFFERSRSKMERQTVIR